MNHFTSKVGFDAISSQIAWLFRASQPPGVHAKGAYFTTLGPTESKLAKRLRIPREKLGYCFAFTDLGDLLQLPGGRGAYVFYSESDYSVIRERQMEHGPTGLT